LTAALALATAFLAFFSLRGATASEARQPSTLCALWTIQGGISGVMSSFLLPLEEFAQLQAPRPNPCLSYSTNASSSSPEKEVSASRRSRSRSAWAAAADGLRTIVCEVASQENASRFFKRAEVGFHEVEMAPNLWSISIDPDESMREYVLLQLKVKAMRDLLFRSKLFNYLAARHRG